MPWYTMLYHAYTMVCHGMPWYTMENRGIPWYTMAYAMEYHGIPWYAMAYHESRAQWAWPIGPGRLTQVRPLGQTQGQVHCSKAQ